jgi:cell wall-associated NlpC family hydrolase
MPEKRRLTYTAPKNNHYKPVFTSTTVNKRISAFYKANPIADTTPLNPLRSKSNIATISIALVIAFISSTSVSASAEDRPLDEYFPVTTQTIPLQTITVADNVVASPIVRDEITATSVEELAVIEAAANAARVAAENAEAARVAAERAAIVSQATSKAIPAQLVPANSIIEAAQQWVGKVPYGSGNNPADSFSCDGYTQYVYAQNGISLPRGVGAQYAMGTEIPKSEAKAGDLLVWKGQHVGIYDGKGGMYDSPLPGRYVQHRSDMWGSPVYVRIG